MKSCVRDLLIDKIPTQQLNNKFVFVFPVVYLLYNEIFFVIPCSQNIVNLKRLYAPHQSDFR